VILINTMSASGGAGRTSVAIVLAQTLRDLGREVLLIQADPINMIPYQLGKPHTEHIGLMQVLSEERSLRNALLSTDSGLSYLPFGGLGHLDMEKLAQQCLIQPERILSLLRDASIADSTVVVCDLPRWPSKWCDVFLSVSDLNLSLLVPDANSMLSIDLMMSSLLKSRGASYYLMNRFDSSHVLHLDMWTLGKMKLGHRLLPFFMHEDQSLSESFAAGITLNQHAPQSLLAEDFFKLTNWIDAELV
jgi:cellulose synthase operon protein YhjQ